MAGKIQTNGMVFTDIHGREMILRGINLGGSSKMPFSPYTVSHIKKGFYEAQKVSFIGRPFPLAEADEHFKRLKTWGFHCLRFLVTWEAIEHEGPGIYDEDYLDYLHALIHKANTYDINIFIDPHQDVWSRFTGGDGAPLWTLEKVGFIPENFDASGVSFTHNIMGDPYPRMEWYTNNFKFAAGTMFTLFWGGSKFAPKTFIQGIPVQEYLQSHYINAFKHLAKKLVDLPNVIGYETMNEPATGFIEAEDINSWIGEYGIGYTPTLWQSMQLASGVPQEVELWEYTAASGIRPKSEKIWKNLKKVKVWKDGYTDIWRENKVWEFDAKGTPKLLDAHYFKTVKGAFLEDHFKPFAQRFINAIREVSPEAIIFIEPPIGMPLPNWKENKPQNVVDASHWYDIHALFSKEYDPEFTINHYTKQPYYGLEAVEQSFETQLNQIKAKTEDRMGAIPTLIGEFGIPMDLAQGKAYDTGEFNIHIKALDAYFRGMEKNLLNYTLWNYTADNTNARGDQWNGEDLSIFSKDQQKNPSDIHSGGRALAAVVRPYPMKIAGKLLSYHFNLKKKYFTMKFVSNPSIEAPTEVFIPSYQFPDYKVSISKGTFRKDKTQERLLIYPTTTAETLEISVYEKR